MKILLAPDKFKGSLSALEVCEAIGAGWRGGQKKAEIHYHPLADGGDGSLEVLARHLDLLPQELMATDPLGRPVPVRYFTDGDRAFIETATASGLVLLKNDEQNPLLTSTFGTGLMMADALEKGFRHVFLFLGGSATNDAGMGIAAALGCRFLDKNNEPLQPIGAHLLKAHTILPSARFDFRNITMTLLCDVTNPLFGPLGAAHTYARQKGAADEQIALLDMGLRHFGELLFRHTGKDVSMLPGSGAAGGIGAGLVALFGAELQSGFAAIAELTGLEKQVQAADLVISGEGRLDAQSLQGKVVSGVAAFCRRYNKPLVLFVGKNDLTEMETRQLGASQVFAISDRAKNLEDAMTNGAGYLREMAGEFF